jgi:hypothetical protein
MSDQEQQSSVPAVLSGVDEDDWGDVYAVAISDTSDFESWVLSFQECSGADLNDPQEISLGMDTYCLVVDPGQVTHYGGVRECELDNGRLRLTFTKEAAATLGTPANVSFILNLTPDQVDSLRRGLARVLRSGRASEVPLLLRL